MNFKSDSYLGMKEVRSGAVAGSGGRAKGVERLRGGSWTCRWEPEGGLREGGGRGRPQYGSGQQGRQGGKGGGLRGGIHPCALLLAYQGVEQPIR